MIQMIPKVTAMVSQSMGRNMGAILVGTVGVAPATGLAGLTVDTPSRDSFDLDLPIVWLGWQIRRRHVARWKEHFN
jgi:hypothetical protein